MSSIILFEDIFVVDKLDPDGKKFDKGEIFNLSFAFFVIPSLIYLLTLGIFFPVFLSMLCNVLQLYVYVVNLPYSENVIISIYTLM